MIEMISGSTRIASRIVRPADGPFNADPVVEKRLVEAGVAVFVYPAARVTSRAFREEDAAQPRIDTETVLPVEESSAPGVTLHEEESGAESKEYADSSRTEELSYDAGSLNALTNARLREIAEGLGLDTSAMRKKADFVDAILALQEADVEEDDGEAPPELDAEEPVS